MLMTADFIFRVKAWVAEVGEGVLQTTTMSSNIKMAGFVSIILEEEI